MASSISAGVLAEIFQPLVPVCPIGEALVLFWSLITSESEIDRLFSMVAEAVRATA